MTSPTARTASALSTFALLLAATALAGCGQKGALYQPQPTEIELGGEDNDDSDDADGGARP